jgi:hypothetical protein
MVVLDFAAERSAIQRRGRQELAVSDAVRAVMDELLAGDDGSIAADPSFCRVVSELVAERIAAHPLFAGEIVEGVA